MYILFYHEEEEGVKSEDPALMKNPVGLPYILDSCSKEA